MVQTYQGMNKEIVGTLRAGGIPHEMYAAQYIEELQAKIEQLEAEIERLRDQLRASVKLTAIREKQLSEELALAAKDKAKIKRLRTACRQAEVFLFRLVRDSGNSDDDPARPVLAVMRKALRETGQ